MLTLSSLYAPIVLRSAIAIRLHNGVIVEANIKFRAAVGLALAHRSQHMYRASRVLCLQHHGSATCEQAEPSLPDALL